MSNGLRRIGVAVALLYSATGFAAEAEDDFAYRCAQPGVMFCVGFDDQTSANAIGLTQYPAQSGIESIAGLAGNPEPAAYPNNLDPLNGYRYPAVDQGVAASGTGSLRLTANPVATAAHSGGWWLGSDGKTAWPESIGAGETLYMQYRARYDRSFAETDWNATGMNGNKQFILWHTGSSCTDLELTMEDSNSRGFPQMYTACGGVGFGYEPGSYSAIPGHVNWLYQHGPNQAGPAEERDFACMRGAFSDQTCSYMVGHADVWWTYHFEVSLGEPGTPTSRVRGWVSRGPNEAMRQFIDWGPFDWNYESGRAFQNLIFTLYATNKSSGNHAPGNVWYDELILSTGPIPIPANVPESTIVADVAPNAPLMIASTQPDPDPDPVPDPEPEPQPEPEPDPTDPIIVDTGAGDMATAAAALSAGQATDFSQPPPIGENGLYWQTEGHYDPARNLVHVLGKAHGCRENGCWDHFIYEVETGTWREVTAGISSYTLEGHIYGNTTMDPNTGELYMHIPYDLRIKRYDPISESWSSMNGDLFNGSTEVTMNGLAYHPNLFGSGQGGLVLQGEGRSYIWEQSTNNWTYQDLGPSSGDNAGVGVWFAAADMAILGRMGHTSGGTRLVTSGPSITSGRTPIQVGGLSTGFHLPFGVIVQHPGNPSKMLLVEKAGDRVWETTDGTNWSAASYSHPFQTPNGAEVITSIPALGVLWMVGRDGNTEYSRIWRPTP